MTKTASTEKTTANPAQVWAVLSDGHRYDQWVQGTKEIRSVDNGWPSQGASIHYTVGAGPITYNNETLSRHCLTERELELEVHAGLLGTVRVDIKIEPADTGCVLTLDEHPNRGVVRVLLNPLSRMGFLARTSVMIEDLIKLAEAEPDPRPPATGVDDSIGSTGDSPSATGEERPSA